MEALMAFTVSTAGFSELPREIRRYVMSVEVAGLMSHKGYDNVAVTKRQYRDVQRDQIKEGIFLTPIGKSDEPMFLIQNKPVYGAQEHPYRAVPRVIRDPSDKRSWYGKIIRVWDVN